MDDFMIIEMYNNRNENAIKETEIKYGRLCYGVAFNILGNNEDAEECVNDTFLSVWNTIPPTKPINFMAFICKITRNLSLKRLDYNTAIKRNSDMICSLSELDGAISYKSFCSDCEVEEIGKLISQFLKREKPDSRAVFIRKYFFLDSISDIEARYSLSESKIKNMLYRSRKRLKQFLNEEGILV